ncbi:MAG: T9SS type A sorting domain-containing protein [Bacteroidales bacterium]|nr:T9SS type A sorting domain-containing protein [Bacteroidales bacterium]
MKNYSKQTIKILLLQCLLLIAFSTKAQFTKLLDFDNSNGAQPMYNQLCGEGTTLYGTTNVGGTNNKGVIFKINTDGTGYTKLLDFDGTNNGGLPSGALLLSGGVLYGTTTQGGTLNLGVVYKINTDGTGYTKLLEFDGTAKGSAPTGSLIIDGSTLYGMANQGGGTNQGVIYKINTDGSGFTKLFDLNGSGGSFPLGALTLSGTTLYGMTQLGGAYDNGAIFKIDVSGANQTVILNFDGSTYGSRPNGSLVLRPDGFLYGIATQGGYTDHGIVFKIQPDGTDFLKLMDFSGALSNGSYPIGTPVIVDQTVYAATQQGGNSNSGVIFSVDTNAIGFTKLHDFDITNGSTPKSSVFLMNDCLYGMTQMGGLNSVGVVFKYSGVVGINKAIADNFKINIIKTPYGVKVESNEIIEKIDVYDLNGKLYNSFTPKKELVNLDLKLASGMYIIRVRTANKEYSKKIEK